MTDVKQDAEELVAKIKEFAGHFKPGTIEHDMLGEAQYFVRRCAERLLAQKEAEDGRAVAPRA